MTRRKVEGGAGEASGTAAAGAKARATLASLVCDMPGHMEHTRGPATWAWELQRAERA